MVERVRDEREAANAMDGPCLIGGGVGDAAEKVEGGKDASERDEQQQEEVKRSWSEIRLAIEELSTVERGRGGGKQLASSPPPPPPPTLPFLALSHLLLQVLDKIGPTMAVLRLDVKRNIEVKKKISHVLFHQNEITINDSLLELRFLIR
ncbi:hypothetical protein ABZP36_002938 [Zizania latifolia]